MPACISRSNREGILGSLPQEGLGPFHQSAEKEHRDVEKAVAGTYHNPFSLVTTILPQRIPTLIPCPRPKVYSVLAIQLLNK